MPPAIMHVLTLAVIACWMLSAHSAVRPTALGTNIGYLARCERFEFLLSSCFTKSGCFDIAEDDLLHGILVILIVQNPSTLA